ncbi:MAG: hypothetical protein H0X66_02185 [Verrucomicrobia bacterium]|nr:hypothetical protein [Verrucomicrobiota bacterium]
MELTELRSKEEVKHDIESTRRAASRSLREAKAAWVTENPAVVAWKRTKFRAKEAKIAVADKAHTTNCAVRSNIYRLLGVAAVAGVAVGFLSRRKKVRKF